MLSAKASDRVFDFGVLLIVVITLVVMVVPMMNVVTLSLLPERLASVPGQLHLIPAEVTLRAYRFALGDPQIMRSILNSLVVSMSAASMGVVVTAMYAYGLSVRIPFLWVFSGILVITLTVRAGLIPVYLMVKNLGLLNTYWALILPQMFTAYHVVLMKAFMTSLPESLRESALIDGANDVQVFFRIVLPLSKPILATIFLFLAVTRWNNYFEAVMYITDNDLRTIQVILRDILVRAVDVDDGAADNLDLGTNVKMATAVLSMLPIAIFYPYLQRYFTRGIMLGAVKG